MNYKLVYKFAKPYANIFYKVIPENGSFTIGDTIGEDYASGRYDAALIQNGKVVDIATNVSKSLTIDKKTFPHLKKGFLSKKVKGYVLLAFRGVVDCNVFTPDVFMEKDGFYTDDWGNDYGLALRISFTDVSYDFNKLVTNFDNVNKTGPLDFSLYKWMKTGGFAVFKEEWDKAIKENPLLLKNAFDKEKKLFAPKKYDQVPLGILDIFDRFDKRVGDLLRDCIGINVYVRVQLENGENGENLKPL